MIHLALLVAAVLFLGYIGFLILAGLMGLVSSGFEQNKGCGCLALFVSVIVVLIIGAGLLTYFS